jgi:predicted RNA binding protein YcfA (HicA-like mRNA interferase family)
MGRLSGCNYRQIIKILKRLGDRLRAVTKFGRTIPNHSGDMPEGTLRAILQQAGIDVDLFLAQK